VTSVHVDLQLPKENHELDREDNGEDREDRESEDCGVGIGAGSPTIDCARCGVRLRGTFPPGALRLSPVDSIGCNKLSSSSTRVEALRRWRVLGRESNPAMRLASSTCSDTSGGKSLPFMEVMTSLNDTVEFGLADDLGAVCLPEALAERTECRLSARRGGLEGVMKLY